MLVLAGPGAGKTFCLIERIRHVVREFGIPPDRICAFTFTNRAAGEIAHRLTRELGDTAELVHGGTIHAFCVQLLRDFTGEVGLERGFGIADEDYQRQLLSRLHQPARFHTNLLKRFSLFRFRNVALHSNDVRTFQRYERFLAEKNLVDFDQIVLKTAELLERSILTAARVRERWDYLLVDEFQDLNPRQYAVVRALACEHRNVFCVGDDDQSIFSWTGADRELFTRFRQDFAPTVTITLDENRRCPKVVMRHARQLVAQNRTLFTKDIRVERDSPFPVLALGFDTEDDELAWLIDDLRRDVAAHDLPWGNVGVLYRRHEIGDQLETQFLLAGIPSRLAQGRALADDKVVKYLMAALRVIASPTDGVAKAMFMGVVLPHALYKAMEAQAAEKKLSFMDQLSRHTRTLPSQHEEVRKIRRASYALRNLAALGRQHTRLVDLVEDLLSQRVGEFRTMLEERHEEVSDPAGHVGVVQLADALRQARDSGQPIWIPAVGGSEIALRNMLQTAGYRAVIDPAIPTGACRLDAATTTDLGLPLALFKALQLNASLGFADTLRDFTVVDLETTGRDTTLDEVVELAAVRVRDGRIVDEIQRLVRPRVPISAGAFRTHGISSDDVAREPYFEDVWPAFRAFIGADILVAHNGYQFDFPILHRMARAAGDTSAFTTYDTLPLARELYAGSRKLADLAHALEIDPGQSHRALDDCRTLARVLPRLNQGKIARARKVALGNLLDHLSIALWLQPASAAEGETARFREWVRVHPFFAYSDALELYRTTRDARAVDAPSVDDVIATLGGTELMEKIRAHKSADQRYPIAMARLRRLTDLATDASLPNQITEFLERVALSSWDGAEASANRVNLLTLHSTKGLEFSRVYIVGVEDAELPGDSPKKSASENDLEESRRLLYVGMTRAKDRLVLTRVAARREKPTGGHRFLDEMELAPVRGERPALTLVPDVDRG